MTPSTVCIAGGAQRPASSSVSSIVRSGFSAMGGASLVIDTNDGVRIDILGLANEFAQNKFLPIVSARSAVFGMPGGGSLYPADGIKNPAAFDGAGGTDTHEPASVYFVSIQRGLAPLLQRRLACALVYSRCLANFSQPLRRHAAGSSDQRAVANCPWREAAG